MNYDRLMDLLNIGRIGNPSLDAMAIAELRREVMKVSDGKPRISLEYRFDQPNFISSVVEGKDRTITITVALSEHFGIYCANPDGGALHKIHLTVKSVPEGIHLFNYLCHSDHA
jgi:hypothetical protein